LAAARSAEQREGGGLRTRAEKNGDGEEAAVLEWLGVGRSGDAGWKTLQVAEERR